LLTQFLFGGLDLSNSLAHFRSQIGDRAQEIFGCFHGKLMLPGTLPNFQVSEELPCPDGLQLALHRLHFACDCREVFLNVGQFDHRQEKLFCLQIETGDGHPVRFIIGIDVVVDDLSEHRSRNGSGRLCILPLDQVDRLPLHIKGIDLCHRQDNGFGTLWGCDLHSLSTEFVDGLKFFDNADVIELQIRAFDLLWNFEGLKLREFGFQTDASGGRFREKIATYAVIDHHQRFNIDATRAANTDTVIESSNGNRRAANDELILRFDFARRDGEKGAESDHQHENTNDC